MPDSYRFEIERRGEIVSTHDLLSQMRVIVGSWRETRQGGRITVTCTLAKAAAAASIRAAVADLQDFINRANEYASDHLSSYECWYRWQTSGESAKRALVHGGFTLDPLDDVVEDVHLDSEAARYIFSFSHDVGYEEIEAQSAISTWLSSVGGYMNLIPTISGGNTKGRIEKLILKPNSNTNSYKAWVGIRPERYGVGSPVFGDINSGFHPVLKFDGGNFSNVAYTSLSVPSDSTAYNGFFVVRDSFADGEDLAIKLDVEIGSDYYVGRYLVLLRAKLSAGSTVCTARLGTTHGAFGSAFYSKPLSLGNTQYITNTSYRFYEMGIIDVPGDRAAHVPVRALLKVFLETGRVSGSASLDTDCLVLIPADHYVTWNYASFGNELTSGLRGDAYIHTTPEGSVGGLVVDPAYVGGATTGSIDGLAYEYAEVGASNWGYPHRGGFLVVATEREGSQVWNEGLFVETHIKRRWELYRT